MEMAHGAEVWNVKSAQPNLVQVVIQAVQISAFVDMMERLARVKRQMGYIVAIVRAINVCAMHPRLSANGRNKIKAQLH